MATEEGSARRAIPRRLVGIRQSQRDQAGYWGVKSQEVLTWVVPSEGHHFASWRGNPWVDKVGRDGSLREKAIVL